MKTCLDRRKLLTAAGGMALFAGLGAFGRVWAQPAFSGDPFQLGVAAGDPWPDGFVIWTRLAPRPLEEHGGMPALGVPVRWEVAEDERFARIVRSENPLGTRGHTFYTARAAVDLEYVRFQDLGRTDALRELDNSTFNPAGQVTHVGTNQVGRYAVHLHHLMGPENPTNTGYQFKFIGNTVSGAKKWAVAVHDTSFGLLDQNVVYDAQGAC